jgi:hypothetical protein
MLGFRTPGAAIPPCPLLTQAATLRCLRVGCLPSRQKHSSPEKAQIAVHGADHLYRELRIENTLTDENGDKVRLKPGGEVEVTLAAESAVTAKNDRVDPAPRSRSMVPLQNLI